MPKTKERITDGEVEPLAVLEAGDVVITRTARFVRHMEGDSPVEAENQEGEVVADAYTRAQGDVVEETLEGELGFGTGFVLTHQPYVARIEEDRAVQVSAEHVRKEAEAAVSSTYE